VGFTTYNEQDSKFEKMMGNRAPSFMLRNEKEIDCRAALDEEAYKRLVVDHNYFSIPNVDLFAENTSANFLAESLKAEKVKSAIIAPIAKNDSLLGVL
ncbi:GAF domain-containing protein, partial [Salinimicrobium sp. CDJ15-91]|nr:GAF domain-containing protein [Salinimicrobium oceani]